MNIGELAKNTGIQLLCPETGSSAEVGRIYAASTMSSLIASASADTLLVTSLCNNQLIRIAELMDAPGLCVASPARPGDDLVALARQRGITLLVSSWDMEETRRRLETRLCGRGKVPR